MAIMASASTPSIFGAPRFGVRHTQTRAAPRRVPTVGGVVSGPGFGARLSGRVRAWRGFGTKTGETHKTANVASLVPGAVRSALSAFRAGSSRRTRPRAAPRGTFNAPGGKYGDDGKARTTTWITHARRFNGKVSTMDAFFGQDDEDRTDAMTATFNTSASGDPVDKNLALPRVPVTLSNDKAVWYWVCLGVAVATFLVPIGYARWGLLTIAPLKWWQVAASTAAGTLLASPYLLALTNPAVSYRLHHSDPPPTRFPTKQATALAWPSWRRRRRRRFSAHPDSGYDTLKLARRRVAYRRSVALFPAPVSVPD